MNSLLLKSLIAGSVALLSASAFAGNCTSEPESNWMSRSEMQSQILAAGYTIDRFKVDGSCYEIYGRNTENQKVEIYFNPVDGAIVKSEIDD